MEAAARLLTLVTPKPVLLTSIVTPARMLAALGARALELANQRKMQIAPAWPPCLVPTRACVSPSAMPAMLQEAVAGVPVLMEAKEVVWM